MLATLKKHYFTVTTKNTALALAMLMFPTILNNSHTLWMKPDTYCTTNKCSDDPYIITVCWHCIPHALIYTPIFGLYTVSVKQHNSENNSTKQLYNFCMILTTLCLCPKDYSWPGNLESSHHVEQTMCSVYQTVSLNLVCHYSLPTPRNQLSVYITIKS